ncbi:MAG: NapC/NirT family cytochrome c, partial [Coriobacteriia bacterium]|nr:NapC/NirT family cytochrome c [Coriobacteriia bacterium]
MAKISLAGFKDPVRRPRYIIWTGVVVMVLAAVVVVALGATSTRWFCAQVCHKVQDDTIAAYEASSHSEVSCMACHEPVNANTVVFILKKMKALGELYLTVTGNYELPLNAGSALALNEEEFGSDMCTQCHSANRPVTPSPGIIIDHKVHEEKEISCTTCHNRVAHNEVAAPPKLISPNGEPSKAHPNFMKMDACFRCHDVDGKKKATGACGACHTPDFKLVPETHEVKTWFPKGHAEAADKAEEKVKEEEKEAEKLKEEGVSADLATPVNYCATCHSKEKFCNSCHGMEMPHPEEFKTKSHPEVAKKAFDKCVMCHEPDKTQFCND